MVWLYGDRTRKDEKRVREGGVGMDDRICI